MAGFIINAIKIIFLLGFLVLIHEGGHFLVAKLCRVKVNEFSIGFGPTLLKFKKRETQYELRLIPLGGFVSMEGEDERSEQEGSFSKASIPKRIAIILAGATVNIIFGLIIYFIIVSINANFYTTTVDDMIDNYAAVSSGIQKNDEIISINYKKVKNKNEISEILNQSNGEDLNIIVKRNNEYINIKLKPTVIENKDLGIYFKANNNDKTKIASIQKDSPAEKSGLKVNDEILKINEIDAENDIYKVVDLIQNSEKEEILLNIKRNNEELDITIKPDIIKSYYLGIVFKKAENTFSNNIYYGMIETKEFLLSIGDNLKQLVTGKVNANQMMGVVGISEVVSNTNGWQEYINMIALVSLSLGITNLLPFPPLDGGKFVILLLELIRKKPMKEEIEIQIQVIGFIILIALSIYVTYNDILRIL